MDIEHGGLLCTAQHGTVEIKKEKHKKKHTNHHIAMKATKS